MTRETEFQLEVAILQAENASLREHLESLIDSYDNEGIDGWEIEVARKVLKKS